MSCMCSYTFPRSKKIYKDNSLRELKAIAPEGGIDFCAFGSLCPCAGPGSPLIIQHDLTVGFQVLREPPSVVNNDPKGPV